MGVPLLVLLLGSASALGCPGSDWAEAGASCYHRSSRSLSWREGNDYCQQQGGYMVEVNSEAEQQLLTGMYGAENYHWIGLTDWNGEWIWRHSHETPTYTNWGPNQPDSADQHCVFLWGTHQGQWADYLCEEHQSSGGRDIHVLCEAEANGTPPLKVLWLGNSYTFYNDLPVMVAKLAAAQGKSVLYSNHTESSWSWKMHAESQLTMELIQSQAWDVVVLQEQSRKPAYPAQTVCEDSIRHLASLVVAIKANNPDTILQFYLTWGRPFGSSEDCPTYPEFCDFPSMQAALTTSYRAFACQNPSARIAPVGESFATYWGKDNFLSLYKNNGGDHHPSLAGSYLSAVSHYSALFNASALGSSYTAGLNKETARALQEAADGVWKGGDWTFPKDTSCTDCLCHCDLA